MSLFPKERIGCHSESYISPRESETSPSRVTSGCNCWCHGVLKQAALFTMNYVVYKLISHILFHLPREAGKWEGWVLNFYLHPVDEKTRSGG